MTEKKEKIHKTSQSRNKITERKDGKKIELKRDLAERREKKKKNKKQ